jgi:hypothetical protein
MQDYIEKFQEYMRYNIPKQLSDKAYCYYEFQKGRFRIYYDSGYFLLLKNDTIIEVSFCAHDILLNLLNFLDEENGEI